MRLKDADGMANSVDPDQTAPRSSLIWVYTVCLDLPVRKLRIITVIVYNVFLQPQIFPSTLLLLLGSQSLNHIVVCKNKDYM